MPIPTPTKGEHHDEFIQRCMSDDKMKGEYDNDQRYAVCENAFTNLAALKISFDYDLTLSTKRGYDLASKLMKEGNTLYIISARDHKEGMIKRAEKLGIPSSRVYATGSNEAKISKVNELGIDIHYDDNSSVVRALKGIGKAI